MAGPTPRNLKAVLEYEGTAYLGWQRQPQGPTVQEVLEEALARLVGRRVPVVGSGRTDAGVHALGQVANFRVVSRIPTERFAAALNAHLPGDVAVLEVTEVPWGFHARRDARWKHYRYTLLCRPSRPALERGRVYHVPLPLDLEAMRAAARILVGRHDFRAFAAADPHRRRRSTVREMGRAAVTRVGERVHLDFVASGFLYRMVRTLAGTLLEVGLGKRPPASVAELLAGAPRAAAGPSLPPRGLTLVAVHYDLTPPGRDV